MSLIQRSSVATHCQDIWGLDLHLVVLDEEVSGGTLAANISIDGQNIVNQDLDLCGQVAPAIGLQCNLKKGLQMASFSVDLSGVPSVIAN